MMNYYSVCTIIVTVIFIVNIIIITVVVIIIIIFTLLLHLSKTPLDSRCKANVELFQIKNIPGPTAHTVGEFSLQRRRSA